MIEVFVDSSVLIEGLKGNPKAVEVLNYLADTGAVAIINDPVPLYPPEIWSIASYTQKLWKNTRVHKGG
ncbi:PIN domain-containing protein [Thermococcus peptonophilus]|uniref:hypothetical protein n=1 Tax=Thermococcus peptonophilus TaxID=53952 RepID=UPI000A741543|nr:hypothetical protein [Thermococcus peptonophilus]